MEQRLMIIDEFEFEFGNEKNKQNVFDVIRLYGHLAYSVTLNYKIYVTSDGRHTDLII